MSLEFELLNKESCIHQFDCGRLELNNSLKDLALLFQRRSFGVTVVFFLRNKIQAKK